MEEFLKTVEKRAFRMIQIATGGSDDTFDLLQDCMMKFVRKYRNKPDQQWKPLFYRIVQNRIRDWYRKEKLKRFIFYVMPATKSDELETFIDPIQTAMDKKTKTAYQQTRDSQAIKKLETELKKLPSRQQQVFLLRAWEGLSTRETALSMNCSQGTVKTHYFRAIKTLKFKLEGIWP